MTTTGPRRLLPGQLTRPVVMVSGVSGLLFVALAVTVAARPGPTTLDVMLVERWSGAVSGPAAYRLGWLIGGMGDPVPDAVAVALLVVCAVASGRRRHAILAVLGPGVTGVLSTALKPLVGRTIHDGNLSFPSGHTGQVVAVALVAALLLTDLTGARPLLRAGTAAAFALIAGAAMAWSQVANQVHYATDTLGGFLLAVAVVPLAAALVDRLAADGQPRARIAGRTGRPRR